MSSDFVHLHVHTEFSLLDGQSQIKDLVSRAAELEMPAVGITDHGVMFGVIDFYRAAKNAGLKPVIGMEAYLAPRKLTDKDAKLDKRPYHMLLLAKNQEGYQNLMQLASVAQLEGYYYRPRIDWEHMEKHSSGLIATSGCLAAEIPRMIEEGRDDEARQQIGKYKEVFGEDNFYLELQPHDIDKLGVLNRWLHDYRKSGHTNVGFLATNDVHYVRREDHDAHDTLLCIQTSAHKSDEKRMKMSPHDSYYLKTTDEMYEEFRRRGLPEDIIRESFANSLKVAQMTDLNLDVDEYRLPIFPVPPRFGEGDKATRDYLRYLVEIGLSWRYPGREDDAVLQERMERELGIIDDMGFNTYFLIVWDLCEFARHADIWWNVRGSGAASLVAYSLGITNIDPIQNSLLFERFLNPGRVSMPDIDLDYPDNRRAEMIAYTADKYGKDKVAAIITFGTMGAKASVKDVGRALDVDLAKINHATSLIPQEARQKKLEVYIESNPELQQLYDRDDEVRRVMETAKKLQGMTRHASTHAAGVIVADKDLREYVPLHRITGTDPSGGSLNAVTQFPMETAESIGLLKVDFLGLSTLTILRKACDLINRHHGTNYTIDNIPYRHDDSRNPLTDEQLHMLDEAFELMGRGETVGVFQVESPGMQAMLRGMRPKKFENIIAGISLYRPGPMEFIPNYNKRLHGEEDVPYKHDKLRPILEETYGILVYQEQIMQVAGELFGYDLGEADLMRRAVSKKKAKALAEHKAIFMERGPQNGISQQVAEEIFDEIEFFANYGFNKSHATDYAVITVQSAFLKQHYPHEFMTALLCVQFDDSDKVSTFLEECRRLNIDVLPPHINNSQIDFDIEEQPDGARGIRFGLGAIKNAGVGALRHIIDEREENGAFESLTDFCHRVDLSQVGKRALESLIKVGALKGFGERDDLLAMFERIVGFSASHHEAQRNGQMSFFGGDSGLDEKLQVPPAPVKQKFTRREQLGWEKELLGLYVTGRPVDRHRDKFCVMPNLSIVQNLVAPDSTTSQGRKVKIAGEIVSIRELITKNNNQMAILHVEDWHETASTIDVVVFPSIWEKTKNYTRQYKEDKLDDDQRDRLEAGDIEAEDLLRLTDGDIVVIQGKFDSSRNEPQVICESISFEFENLQPDDIIAQANSYGRDYAMHETTQSEMPPPPDDNTYHDNNQPPTPTHTEYARPATQGATTQSGSNGSNGNQTQGNGHHPADSGDNTFDDLLGIEDDGERSTVHIDVRFYKSDDPERDRRKLQRLHRTLVGYPGKNTFALFIVDTDGDRTTVLDFPNHTTGYSEALLHDLVDIVGEDNIHVTDSEEQPDD